MAFSLSHQQRNRLRRQRSRRGRSGQELVTGRSVSIGSKPSPVLSKDKEKAPRLQVPTSKHTPEKSPTADAIATPKTEKSLVSHRSSTTTGASSGGGDSFTNSLVYHRKDEDNSKGIATWKSPLKQQRTQLMAPEDNASVSPPSDVSSSVISYRMQLNYAKHVQKMRAGPHTEKHETQVREQNVYTREIKDCTFQPKTQWKRQSATLQDLKPRTATKHAMRRSKIIMEPGVPSHKTAAFRRGGARKQGQQPLATLTPSPAKAKTEAASAPAAPCTPPPIPSVICFFTPKSRYDDMKQSLASNIKHTMSPLYFDDVVPSLDGFDAIAGRHSPPRDSAAVKEEKQSNETASRKQKRRSRRRSNETRAPDYGSV